MQITGMLHGAKLLAARRLPHAEILGPDATEEQIKALLDKRGELFVKPVFSGGVGKKGKAGLIGARTRPEDRAGREGAPLLRRAPPRQRMPRPTA